MRYFVQVNGRVSLSGTLDQCKTMRRDMRKAYNILNKYGYGIPAPVDVFETQDNAVYPYPDARLVK